jgi:BolA protein
MPRPDERPEIIRKILADALETEYVSVADDSARHSGHLGAQGGGGHFRVVVVSTRFEGLSRVAAQRLVYRALGELMTTDIHALEMRTLTPEQWNRLSG